MEKNKTANQDGYIQEYANLKDITKIFGYRSVHTMKQYIDAALADGAMIRAIRPRRSRYAADGHIHYCIDDVRNAFAYRL